MGSVKREGSRSPTIAIVVGLICVVVALGAGLQGRFVFGGPRWDPGNPMLPSARPSPPPPPPTPVPTAPPQSSSSNHWLAIGAIALAVVLAVLILGAIVWLVRYLLKRRRGARSRVQPVGSTLDDLPFEQFSEIDLPVLQRGLSRAAAVLDSDREPRDAIVRAWIGLQEAAEDSGLSRRPSETPTEFTTRVFATVDADRTAASTLLEVYLRVRFRSVAATEADVAAARDSILRLRETWPERMPE